MAQPEGWTMSGNDLGVEIAEVIRIALAAGDGIMKIYRAPFEVCLKADSSPVTKADILAEEIILEGLRRVAPGIPIVAEESACAGAMPDVIDTFFLVDPLDGTKEFVSRSDEFTVNIGLISQGAPVLGVIYAPATGEIAYTDPENGPFAGRVVDGEIVDLRPIRTRKFAPTHAVAVVSRSHCDDRTRASLALFSPSETAALGSSLKLCRIAEGLADIYPRHGPTMQWDTAAGDAILRAAGGCVVAPDGLPLRYARVVPGATRDFGNPDFFAFGDPALAERL
jgi:3'(2'), 5'-bisphosphate nucleotidase